MSQCEVLHQVDEMAEIATEAIEPPDDDHVSLPRRLEEGGEPRAVLTLSGRLVDESVRNSKPRHFRGKPNTDGPNT